MLTVEMLNQEISIRLIFERITLSHPDVVLNHCALSTLFTLFELSFPAAIVLECTLPIPFRAVIFNQNSTGDIILSYQPNIATTRIRATKVD